MLKRSAILAIPVLCLLVQLSCLAAANRTAGCETVVLTVPPASGQVSVDVQFYRGRGVYAEWDIVIANLTSETIVMREAASTLVGESGRSWQLGQVVFPYMSSTVAPSSFVSSRYSLPGYIASGDVLRLTLLWDEMYGRTRAQWIWQYRCSPADSNSDTHHNTASVPSTLILSILGLLVVLGAIHSRLVVLSLMGSR